MRLAFGRVRLRLPRVGLIQRRTPVGKAFHGPRLRLTGRERLLVIAPHCDDETLGAGGLLHDAVQLGCRVHVVIVTNGDGFRYAAGRQYKRLSLPPEKQIEFAYLRQQESVRALAELGVPAEQIAFLGYPDRGLQAMWNDHWEPDNCYRSPFTRATCSPYRNSCTPGAPYCGRALVNDLLRILATVQPSHVVVPHHRDAHGDHTASFCFVTHALEEWRTSGRHRDVQVLAYLVHRGPWPQPRGFHPRLELVPPASFSGLTERWLAYSISAAGIKAKHRAILKYRSQLSLQSRYLLSFVRRNELFSLYAPTHVREVPAGEVFVDGKAKEWPPGVGYVPDPVRDTLTRNVERGADVKSLAVCADPGYLYLRLEMYGKAVDEVTYTVRLAACQRDRRKLDIRLVVPNQALVRRGRQWVPSAGIVCRSAGRVIEAAVPRSQLGDSVRVLIGAETRYRQLTVDRTAWQLLILPQGGDQGTSVMYTTAAPEDLPGIAAVFAQAFAAEIVSVLRSQPQFDMLLHLLEVMYEAEPQGFLLARRGAEVIGYVYAPLSLRRLWQTALSEGHLWRWFTNWIRGRYHIGFNAVRVLLLDKYYFVRSALRDPDRIQNRILSVAVVPQARGQGVGTRLVQLALQRFRELKVERVRLEVRPDNEPAIHIYRKLGFVHQHTVSDTRGEWWVMVKELTPGAPQSAGED